MESNALLQALTADREVDYKPTTLTPVWPLARELKLADMRGDKLGDSDND